MVTAFNHGIHGLLTESYTRFRTHMEKGENLLYLNARTEKALRKFHEIANSGGQSCRAPHKRP